MSILISVIIYLLSVILLLNYSRVSPLLMQHLLQHAASLSRASGALQA